MDSNLISIILPVYNGEQYLASSIESCLNQSYRNIELIIVNDCSTDSTLLIAKKYAKIDSRIRIISNANNKKLPASLNIGHKEAKGDYMTWTSDDNLYDLKALEKLLFTLVKQKADIVYSDYSLIDKKGQIIGDAELRGFENIIFGNFVQACFLYKKEVFRSNNGYDENLFLVEDYDFWLRALISNKFFHLKKKLYYYRKHEGSLTSAISLSKNKKQLWKDNLKTMYINFCLLIGEKEKEEIGIYLAKRLSFQMISFEWFVTNQDLISNFKYKLKRNINFSNEELIEKVFLKKTIEAMINDKDYKSNLSKSIFIVKKYARFMDKNDIKTIIKYAFLKTNK